MRPPARAPRRGGWQEREATLERLMERGREVAAHLGGGAALLALRRDGRVAVWAVPGLGDDTARAGAMSALAALVGRVRAVAACVVEEREGRRWVQAVDRLRALAQVQTGEGWQPATPPADRARLVQVLSDGK